MDELVDRAERLGMELIPDSDGNMWCCRPYHYDNEGRRVVRYQPDPCEFKYSLGRIRELLDLWQ